MPKFRRLSKSQRQFLKDQYILAGKKFRGSWDSVKSQARRGEKKELESKAYDRATGRVSRKTDLSQRFLSPKKRFKRNRAAALLRRLGEEKKLASEFYREKKKLVPFSITRFGKPRK